MRARVERVRRHRARVEKRRHPDRFIIVIIVIIDRRVQRRRRARREREDDESDAQRPRDARARSKTHASARARVCGRDRASVHDGVRDSFSSVIDTKNALSRAGTFSVETKYIALHSF